MPLACKRRKKLGSPASLPEYPRKSDILAFLQISVNCLMGWVRSGHFPQPLRLGGGRRGILRWRRADVLKFLEDRRRESRRRKAVPA